MINENCLHSLSMLYRNSLSLNHFCLRYLYPPLGHRQPHGRSFLVHKTKEFTDRIMPKYFNQGKFASFQRQLNLYGFKRLTRGPDAGSYYNELFLRGRPDQGQRGEGGVES